MKNNVLSGQGCWVRKRIRGVQCRPEQRVPASKKTTTTAFVWLPPGTEYTKEPSIGIYEETHLEVMQCPSHKSGSCADRSGSCVDKSGSCEEHSMLCPARQARRKSTLKKPQPNLWKWHLRACVYIYVLFPPKSVHPFTQRAFPTDFQRFQVWMFGFQSIHTTRICVNARCFNPSRPSPSATCVWWTLETQTIHTLFWWKSTGNGRSVKGWIFFWG